jgi:signal transduction histidine kinase
MNKLFTPFFSTKPEVKGVGLGLPVAYGIVQRHQGRIEVRSKVGEGSTFTVCLPLHPKPARAK